MANTEFEKAIERSTGETIKAIRNTPVDEMRRRVEAKTGSPMRIISYWPLIGRCPVQTISGEEVNKLVDKAIK